MRKIFLFLLTATLTMMTVFASAAKFTSAENGPSVSGNTVLQFMPSVQLYASAEVGGVVQGKFSLQRDGAPLASPVHAGSFDNQAFVQFMGDGWTAAGVYTLVIEAGAATIGGVPCEAQTFSWGIGTDVSDVPEATSDVDITAATCGGNAAGSELDAMSANFELTLSAKGLTSYDTDYPFVLKVNGTQQDWINHGSVIVSGNKVSFSLNSSAVLNTPGTWTLTIPGECLYSEAIEWMNNAATFSWTVRQPSAPAVAPTLVSATNDSHAAGSKVTSLTTDFYITLSQPSRYSGYGVWYWYEGITDQNAIVSVAMEDDVTAHVSVTGADLTREGTHTINITYGAFVHKSDETKVLTQGQRFDWIIGGYSLRDVRNGSSVGHIANTSDEVDKPFFENRFTAIVSAPSTAANPFTAVLLKNGATYLSQAQVKPSADGREFEITFQDWPHSTTSLPSVDEEGHTTMIDVTTYLPLEPADYTLSLSANAFASNNGDHSEAWSGIWHVVDKVYAWSLDNSGTVNGAGTNMSKTPASLESNFTIAFQSGVSDVTRGEGAITLSFISEDGSVMDTIYTAPTSVSINGGSAYVVFGSEKLTRNGMYSVNVAKDAFMGTYTPDGKKIPVTTGCAAGSFAWTVRNVYEFVMPESGMTTLSVDYMCQWPSGATVYYVADMKEGKVLLQEAKYHPGESDERRGYMTAGTGLVVKGTPGETYKVQRPIDPSNLISADNLLIASVDASAAADGYVLEGTEFVRRNTAHAAHTAWLMPNDLTSQTLTICYTMAEYDTTTAMDTVDSATAARKLLIRGQLIIIRDGVMYNIQGIKL